MSRLLVKNVISNVGAKLAEKKQEQGNPYSLISRIPKEL